MGTEYRMGREKVGVPCLAIAFPNRVALGKFLNFSEAVSSSVRGREG